VFDGVKMLCCICFAVEYKFVQQTPNVFNCGLLIHFLNESLSYAVAVIFKIKIVVHKFNSGHDPLIVLFGFLLFCLELFGSNLHLLKVSVDMVSPLSFEVLHLELVYVCIEFRSDSIEDRELLIL